MTNVDPGLGYAHTSGRWGWFVALGLVLIAGGVFAFGNVALVSLISVIFIGASMLVGGIFQIIHAITLREGWGASLFSLAAGVLYVIGGILIMQEPVQGSVIITLFILVALVIGGILRVVIALRHRELAGWWLMLLGGLISIVVGIMLYNSLPWSGFFVLGTLVAIEMIVQGVTWLAFGLSLRRLRHAVAARLA